MRIMSIQSFHDSSVAVLNDGKLEYFFKEERYTRKKRQSVPYKAILKALEVTQGKIDHVVIDQVKNNAIPFFIKKFLDCPIHDKWDCHHLSHAWLAYYNSGFKDEALVFVIDREGSNIADLMRECESVYKMWYPTQCRNLQKNFWLHNKGIDYVKHYGLMNNPNWVVNADTMMGIAKVYESANTLIGQNEFESGKTMGLAAYGKDQPYQALFHDGRPVDSLFIHDYFPTKSETKSFAVLHKKHVNRITLDVAQSDYEFYADYAYQVQKQTQEEVLNLVKLWVETSGIKQVCLTGGYAMNVVTNGYLVKNLPDVKFYFEPMADDTGNSIGQAMHFYNTIAQSADVNPQTNLFFHGVEDTTDIDGETCTEKDIAKLLKKQKIVAVYNGLAEAGQRALGNRSILFDARNENAKEIVNKVKNREWYRPFAAAVLKENFADYFDTYGLTESPFMTISFPVTSKEIPGVTHVDNTCRVQTVDIGVPHLYNLLREFKKQTDCSVLLNTSFNVAGQPLIETVAEAIETFNNSDIDVLWFPKLKKMIRK